MFQQFNPSIRSTLHRVTFAFVDWQYHTRFPVVRDTSFRTLKLISNIQKNKTTEPKPASVLVGDVCCLAGVCSDSFCQLAMCLEVLACFSRPVNFEYRVTWQHRQRACNGLPLTGSNHPGDTTRSLSQGFTSHSAQDRSFRRWSSRSTFWQSDTEETNWKKTKLNDKKPKLFQLRHKYTRKWITWKKYTKKKKSQSD